MEKLTTTFGISPEAIAFLLEAGVGVNLSTVESEKNGNKNNQKITRKKIKMMYMMNQIRLFYYI